MGLLKKKTKKPLKIVSRSAGAGGEQSPYRPQEVIKTPPCISTCPSDNDIRGWLSIIAQRDKIGLSLEEACDKAWLLETETNPFPSIMGRVCPHPCEGDCNRKEKDGAVAINSVERYIGDWGIERDLKLPTIDAGGPFPEKIAVIGAGPAGLSCAYQMARRGYAVTVFERLPRSGGMLRYGIPEYRLPRNIIDSEVQRIADLGVELKYGVTIGKDITLEELQKDHAAIFLAIGAHQGRKLGVPGEDGPGVYTGTEFLRGVNAGDPPPVGKRVVVIGGGDTAIDAARVSLRLGLDAAGVTRRAGSDVTILYRRTRTEMPAIDREIEEAIEEKIHIEFLAAPAKVLRNGEGQVEKLVVQRMELGEPDSSGRRRPLPIEGDVYELEVDTIVTAVSQSPDTGSLGAFTDSGWPEADEWGHTPLDGVWSGGDNLHLGIATTAIGQGRRAALAIHASLRGETPRIDTYGAEVGPDKIKLDFYDSKPPAVRDVLSPAERVANATVEIDHGITQAQALEEVTRCFSCGDCFGCERCWMYCTPTCFSKAPEPGVGRYYRIKLDNCNGCKKCAEECPCGFLDMV